MQEKTNKNYKEKIGTAKEIERQRQKYEEDPEKKRKKKQYYEKKLEKNEAKIHAEYLDTVAEETLSNYKDSKFLLQLFQYDTAKSFSA